MRKIFLAFSFCFIALGMNAQRVLSLDSCRALAMRNNKQLNVSKLKQDIAMNIRKAARTKYLPKVDAIGGYEFFSKEISLLSNTQKSTLNGLGTNALGTIGSSMNSEISNMLTGLVQQGLISQQMAQQIGSQLSTLGPQIGSQAAQVGDQIGHNIASTFRTDTRNIWTGAIMVRQPIFMGGAITAANKMADISELMASDDVDFKKQSTIYNIDQAYWTVVSLRQKEKLAHSFHDLIEKLDNDVRKMIKEGVATRADGLKVDVKVNESDMQITQVEDGLVLARMLLCQLCGLPVDEKIALEDEFKDSLSPISEAEGLSDTSFSRRPEVRMLENTVELTKQNTHLVRAGYLPHVALTGGYQISNPNVFNGFQRNFAGVWNIGILVQVPLWNWFEGSYNIRASKAATNIAMMELSDLQEKINLQVTQSQFKVKEAQKHYRMTQNNMKSAEENLRCANIGFKEGVIEIADVMAAQTAWQQAQSQKIDAEIDLKLAQVGLKKSLGILQ